MAVLVVVVVLVVLVAVLVVVIVTTVVIVVIVVDSGGGGGGEALKCPYTEHMEGHGCSRMMGDSVEYFVFAEDACRWLSNGWLMIMDAQRCFIDYRIILVNF